MVTNIVYPSLSNSALYKNIKKLYKSSGKCNYQQQYKDILEAEMVYTTEISRPSVTVKNPNEIKSLHLFTEVFDVKNKTAVCQVGDAKLTRKAIISDSMLWSSITKKGGYKNQ